jgi:hypothetical protein
MSPVPLLPQTLNNSRTAYKKFWQSGGAVDFSAVKDPRAFEIERRACVIAISYKNSMLIKLSSAGNRIDL